MKVVVFYARVIILCAIFSFSAFAQEGDESAPDVIIFGQTAALEGPVSALGIGMEAGLRAAFKEINDQGGVHGRKLELISYDDGYEPDQAIENSKVLIYKDNVFALIGGVGTPTANVIEPIATGAKVPFIAPFTGAEFLRSPFKRYVLNVRGSYWQETEEWVERLTSDLGVKRISILYQDDSYGRAGLSGVRRAMKKRGLKLVGEATYERNTVAVKAAVLKLRKANPEVVVMVGAYKPCAEFIKISRKIGFNPRFVNISFVGSDALAKELEAQGEGVIVSQVVPFPYENADSALVDRYQRALKNYDEGAEFGFVSLEGYMAGRFTIEVLKNIEGEVTRERFIDQVYEMGDISLDDVTLRFGENDNQGMDKVFMTVLQADGSFKNVERLSDGGESNAE